MVSVTSASRYIASASRYHTHYQSRSSMYIRGLIPRNSAELAEAVPIAVHLLFWALNHFSCSFVLPYDAVFIHVTSETTTPFIGFLTALIVTIVCYTSVRGESSYYCNHKELIKSRGRNSNLFTSLAIRKHLVAFI